MSIEEMIKAWKSGEEDEERAPLTNPVGEELTDQELEQATGGCIETCTMTCPWTFAQ